MEYYLAFKRNEVLIYTTIWLNLENIILDERRQTHRPHIVWFHLHGMSTIGKLIQRESRLLVGRVLEWGQGGMTANGYRISFGSDENVLKLGSGDSYIIL